MGVGVGVYGGGEGTQGGGTTTGGDGRRRVACGGARLIMAAIPATGWASAWRGSALWQAACNSNQDKSFLGPAVPLAGTRDRGPYRPMGSQPIWWDKKVGWGGPMGSQPLLCVIGWGGVGWAGVGTRLHVRLQATHSVHLAAHSSRAAVGAAVCHVCQRTPAVGLQAGGGGPGCEGLAFHDVGAALGACRAGGARNAGRGQAVVQGSCTAASSPTSLHTPQQPLLSLSLLRASSSPSSPRLQGWLL